MKIPILDHDGILMTSFQDDMTDRDGLSLQADLLAMIEETGSQGVLMDVSSLESIDSYQARMISETAVMAGILGCQVVLTGMQPQVALTLVELGSRLSTVRTALNVDMGLDLLRNTTAGENMQQ